MYSICTVDTYGRTGRKSDISKPHVILQTLLFGNQPVIVQRLLLSRYLHCNISNVKISSPIALCNVYHFPCLLVSRFTKNTFSYFRHSAVQQLCQLLLDPTNQAPTGSLTLHFTDILCHPVQCAILHKLQHHFGLLLIVTYFCAAEQ